MTNQTRDSLVVSFDSAPATPQAMRMALGLARSTGTDVRVVGLEDQPSELAHEETERHLRQAVSELRLEEVVARERTSSPDRAGPSWRYRTKDDKVLITVEIRQQLVSRKLRAKDTADNSLVVLVEDRPKSIVGRLYRRLEGSEAAQLISETSRPVYVCRSDHEWPPKRILCPVDHSVTSARALDSAIDIARRAGATLDVLSVVTPHRTFAERMGFLDLTEDRRQHEDMMRRARADLDAFLFTTRWRGVSWLRAVRRGDMDVEVARHAAARHIDLVVVGRVPRRAGAASFERAAVARMLQRLPCSLLTVEPTPAARRVRRSA